MKMAIDNDNDNKKDNDKTMTREEKTLIRQDRIKVSIRF
jgi:hypothetical protein